MEKRPTGSQCHPLASECFDSFLEESKSTGLSELGGNLSRMFGVMPVVATAICEHVFQELAFQFFERGVAYIPNFGWIYFVDGKPVFEPCPAVIESCGKISKGIGPMETSLAGWEIRLRNSERDSSAKQQSRGIVEPNDVSAGNASGGGGSERDRPRAGAAKQEPF